jgi:hypothetical protein
MLAIDRTRRHRRDGPRRVESDGAPLRRGRPGVASGPLIRFHYHLARADTPHLGIRRGDRLCHVFSDLADLGVAAAELRAWADARGLGRVRVQDRGLRRQHLDLWGGLLALCGPPAERATLRRWLRGEA